MGEDTSTATIPNWVVYPEKDWIQLTPTQAGFDTAKFSELLARFETRGGAWEGEVHENNDWGTVLTRGGYLVHIWGNPDYKYQTASVGKAFTRAVLGLAVDAGIVDPDTPIWKMWTGDGQLSHTHKHLGQGHHQKLTWRHLIGAKDKYEHYGGFPVTNGYFWRQASSSQSSREVKGVPAWAQWTGDPFYDNYAHAEPGTVAIYSSGGIWRLSQALTAVWNQDIKQVLDERLFAHMGIPPDGWDWVPGRVVHENRNFYPRMPGYGEFIDPPYEINGQPVRGGGGWVVMSPADLARFGLLVATRGIWKGKQLLSPEWLRNHGGGNGSWAGGFPETFIAVGKVTTDNLPPLDVFNKLIVTDINLLP